MVKDTEITTDLVAVRNPRRWDRDRIGCADFGAPRGGFMCALGVFSKAWDKENTVIRCDPTFVCHLRIIHATLVSRVQH